jgi:hypothetical protein
MFKNKPFYVPRFSFRSVCLFSLLLAAAAPVIEEMDFEFDEIDGFEIMASSVERP